ITTTLPVFAFNSGQIVGRDGRLYVMGGAVWQSPYTPTNHLFIYDPATHVWSEGAPMPTARFAFYPVIDPDGRIYAVGGQTGRQTCLTTVEIYDPPTNTWTTGVPMTEQRGALYAGIGPDGLLYAIGGVRGPITVGSSNPKPTNTYESFSFTTNTWTPRGS